MNSYSAVTLTLTFDLGLNIIHAHTDKPQKSVKIVVFRGKNGQF